MPSTGSGQGCKKKNLFITMESNVYLIRWYGPFKTRKDVKDFEAKHRFKCSLYLLHGKLSARERREKYYCGMSTREIYKRLSDKGHHIEEIEENLNSIYVGCISNVRRSSTDKILLTENIITAVLAEDVGDNQILNKINKKYPATNVYVINEWWRNDGSRVWERQRCNAPSHIVPDVISYRYDETDGCYSIHRCQKLKKYV